MTGYRAANKNVWTNRSQLFWGLVGALLLINLIAIAFPNDTLLYGWPFTLPLFALLILFFRTRFSWPEAGFFIAYLIHQFEEWGYDLTGTRYATIEPLIQQTGFAFTPDYVLMVNSLIIGCLGLEVLFRSEKTDWPLQAFVGVMVINGIVHTGFSISVGGYSPGVATALLLFIPLLIWFFKTRNPNWPVILGFGLGLHAAIYVILPLHTVSPWLSFPFVTAVALAPVWLFKLIHKG